MTYVYRKYENPETKQMVDLQELINDLFEVNKELKKELDEAQGHLVELKDKVYDLHTRLADREDEINSLSLRVLKTEEDDIELDNKIYEYYNKIERVSIELDNHSHQMRKRINTYMKTRKAAKILIKRAKENPDLYTEQEVEYAKLLRKHEPKLYQNLQSQLTIYLCHDIMTLRSSNNAQSSTTGISIC